MGALLFIALFVLLFLGVPIGLCLGLAALFTMAVAGDFHLFPVVVQRMFNQVDNFTLMAVPLFILAGNLMLKGGISKRLITFIELLARRLPARLAGICVIASAFFGAISGSNPATVAAIGGILAPRMIEKGYPKAEAGAIAASAGTLGVIIPPSIPMVTYAVTASVSVGTMFMGGVIPGILLAVVLCVVNGFANNKYDAADTTPRVPGELGKAFVNAILALIMPLIILGGIYGGFFTPTEAGAVSCVYALIIGGLVYRELDGKALYECFRDSVISASIVLFVVGMSAPFAWYMTFNNIPSAVATGLISAFSNKFALLLVMNIILLFLGMFLETQSIILLMTPIFLPMANAIGLSPIALGIIIIINTSIGMITPPMAVNLFVASGITHSTMGQISKKIIKFLIAEILTLLVFTYFPQIITFLPTVTGGGAG